MSLDAELADAVINGNFSKAEGLFRRGAKATYREPDSCNHLIYAAIENNSFNMAELLLNNGADSELDDIDKMISLVSLASNPSLDSRILGILIDRGIKENLPALKLSLVLTAEGFNLSDVKFIEYSTKDLNLLHYAAYNGKLKVVQEIFKLPVEKRGDINQAESYYGWTPLHCAIYYNRGDIARILLSENANVESRDMDGLRPLHYAARNDRLDTVQLLVERGADINAKDNHGKTPLEYANSGSTVANFLREKNRACERPIYDIKDDEKDFFFLDNNGDLIFTTPKSHQASYTNMSYQPARSKHFNPPFSPGIDDVLPNSFTFRYGYIKFIIKYDSLSQQEQNRVKTDIETAYNAFREMFCFAGGAVNKDLVFYIFNNKADFQKYNNLLGLNADNVEGVTDYNKVLTFKSGHMGGNLGHELTHILQVKFSEPKIRGFVKRERHAIPYFIELKVYERNYKAIEVANSSMEVENGNRSRRSIEQPYVEPPSLINDLFSRIKEKGSLLVSGIVNSVWPASVAKLSEETSYGFTTKNNLEPIDYSQIDMHGTILLLDTFIRKFTGQKYISSNTRGITEQEALGCALSIKEGFEKVVEQAASKSGISMHRLDIDFVKVQEEVTRKITGGEFNEISGVLSSYIEKACPSREAGCPGKLNPKKFDKFMTEFNRGLDVTLMQQILNNRGSTLEVNDVKEQQINLGPKSYLNGTSVQGHLTQDRSLK